MGKNDWIPIAPGLVIKPCEDGQVVARLTENIADTLQGNAELRKETKSNSKVGNMGGVSFLQARHGYVDEIAIREQCGLDPEKRQAYLRDHPELQAAPQSKAAFPTKKAYSFPSALRPRGGRK